MSVCFDGVVERKISISPLEGLLNQIKDMQESIDQLTKDVAQIKEAMGFVPGNNGYKETKEHFEEMQK